MGKLPTSPFVVREMKKVKESSAPASYYTDRDMVIKEWISKLSPEDHAKLTTSATEIVKNMKNRSRNSITGHSNMIFSVETAEILLVLIALHGEIRVVGG